MPTDCRPARAAGISKSFGGVAALRDVDFSLRAGRDPRPGRRERRRQVDADEDHRRRARRVSTARCARRPARCISARRAMRWRPASAWCTRNCRVVPDLTRRRERLSRRAADQRGRPRRLAGHDGAGAREHLADLGIDVDPERAHGRAADRPAAADRAGARAVLRRPHHHPRRADLGAVAARGRAAVRRAARLRASGRSIVFISHFLDDMLAISDTVTVFRNGRRIATESRRRRSTRAGSSSA